MAVGRILISKGAIQQRVRELASEINGHYGGKPLMILGLLNGSLFFLVDLMRHLKGPDPITLECWRVRSYAGTSSSGKVEGLEMGFGEFRGRHVLIVDDILDTGLTLSQVRQRVLELGARSVRFCVLLDKKKKRARGLRAHWRAFEIPDHFVVGYGLDCDGHHRLLPEVRLFDPNE